MSSNRGVNVRVTRSSSKGETALAVLASRFAVHERTQELEDVVRDKRSSDAAVDAAKLQIAFAVLQTKVAGYAAIGGVIGGAVAVLVLAVLQKFLGL